MTEEQGKTVLGEADARLAELLSKVKKGPRKTATGRTVHRRVIDHHPDGSKYQRFNKQVAIALTKYVGTMTCFWIFCVLSLLSLPAVLSAFSVFSGVFPAVIIKTSVIALVAWVAQTFIQLVLLPALMVGQNLQNVASDVRSEKQFDDTELIVDRLNVETEGGLQVVLAELSDIEALIAAQSAETSLEPVTVTGAGNEDVLMVLGRLEMKVDALRNHRHGRDR